MPQLIDLERRSAIRKSLSKPNKRIGLKPPIPCRFHLRRVVEIVDSSVRFFQREVPASGGRLLTVHQDPALHCCQLAKIEDH